MKYVSVKLCLDKSTILGCLEMTASVGSSSEGSVSLKSMKIAKTVDPIA